MSQKPNDARGVLVAAVLAAAGFYAASAHAEAFAVGNAKVSVVCPMTVGGSFEARSTALTGEVDVAGETPASVTAALSVDLSTLNSGIDFRDRHMLDNYLEVAKGEDFKDAKLTNIKLDAGKLDGQVPFHASFSVHGQTRDVTGTAKIRKSASGYDVEASFPMKVSDYQIPKPTYLGVGVKDELKVNVAFSATPKSEGSK